MDYMEQTEAEEMAFLLSRPSDAIIDTLASDPDVSALDVREVLNDIVGMTLKDALDYVFKKRDANEWSLATVLAVMDGIDSVRNVPN